MLCSQQPLGGPLTQEIGKNPFKAADEKVPLSVVHVNKKPQHLSFCLRSRHQIAKQRHLPVESSKGPCETRVSSCQICPKTGASSNPQLHQPQNPSLVPAGAGDKTQKQCILAGWLCELWRLGRIYAEEISRNV